MIYIDEEGDTFEMTDTIKLDDYRPHDTFNAVCIGCGYSWQAVIDARHEGMLECPECGAMAGKERKLT